MIKVFSIKKLFYVGTSRCALNFIGISLCLFLLYTIIASCRPLDWNLKVIVFHIEALILSSICVLPVNNKIKPEKIYENAYTLKKLIIKENQNKSGIYSWTNKLTGNIYIGQSVNLSAWFKNYYNVSYLSSKHNLIICRALIKYGYSNFSLEILEYCDLSVLVEREQYYLDKFKGSYNILKVAGSSIGNKHYEETKAKISKSLKGIYTGKNSALFGRTHSKETRILMSQKKVGNKNPLPFFYFCLIKKKGKLSLKKPRSLWA